MIWTAVSGVALPPFRETGRLLRAIICMVILLAHVFLVRQLLLETEWKLLTSDHALINPTITLTLLPLVLENASEAVIRKSVHEMIVVSQKSIGRSVAVRSQPLSVPAESRGERHEISVAGQSTLQMAVGNGESEGPSSLNLAFPKEVRGSGFSEITNIVKQHPMVSVSRERMSFSQAFGSEEGIREERLSATRVRVHTKYGCYELEQSASKRIDPYQRSLEYVTKCR